MKLPLRTLLRELVPPLGWRWGRRVIAPRIFSGNYVSWSEARAHAGGYDAPAIMERVLEAARAVRDGEAAWERDSVLFPERSCHWPVLSALLRAAARTGGQLHVVDFGGAFGSVWWQHRHWLRGVVATWRVVEQPAFVAAGRREFSLGPLSFHESVDAALDGSDAQAILLSSVLPYLEKPRELLLRIGDWRFEHVIIDRTGFTRDGRDRLVVQQVPPRIYPASYPCWFFDRTRLLGALGPSFELVDEWSTFDVADIPADYRGCYLERRR